MEWEKVKLGEIIILHDSKRVPLSSLERAKRKGNYPYYGAASIVDYIDSYIFDGDYILLGEDGTVINDNGTPILQRPSGQFWVSNHAHVITNREGVDFDFLYYVLCNTNISSAVTGAVQMKVSQKNLLNIELPLPPIETQRRIAAILSSLDDKIENNNRINRNLEAQAQALFKSWFVDFEPWGGTMPEDWKEGTLGDIVTVKRGGSPRPIQDYLSDKGYRWLKISDATAEASPFISHIVEHIKEEGLSKTVFIKQGSLVLSNSATPGLPKFVDLDTCIHDGWLYFPQSYFSNEYLYLLFQRERSYLLSQGNGSVFTNLKTDIVKNLSVTIPSEDVLNSFQQIVGRVFMEILNNQRESHRLAALRDTLLPKLMRGEITL